MSNNIVSIARKTKSRIIIEIETSDIRKLAKEELDANGDQVIDEVATQEFERKIHHLIASSIQDFVDDADRLDEDVIESLTTEGYDMDTLMSDPTYGNLQELGKIDVTVKQEPIEQNQTTDAIYGTCQDCGQLLTREAYELHNADHSISVHNKEVR